ncbi:rRNA cytosine-C5-methyltransferase [Massilibacteroides sp.]|uniref:methyltransferase RsmF C-terminal domain-like protein n=1 Tax=Massilibacteroides sp. TaxID=2034766 RepID=UPI002622AD1B|nr:rRNA cytosine-C5-methyltransferase [Massilibacteroides sp.]MDD4516236.1 rRNA cytosine-C5-methyltransferase [Massilibacteroides sp.]
MELPVDFVIRTRTLLGDDYDHFEKALATDTPVSIRLNRRKELSIPVFGEQIPWCDMGYYLPERLTFTFDPLFHAGGYYVQEASSMFLEQAIRTYVKEPVRCLDLCAAPGGKSTHLLDLLPEDSLLISNEVIRNRSLILAENVTKWGAPNVIISNEDPEKIGQLTHYFDVIVTDVPCSGEGMFRKDEDSRDEWSIANVQLCASRQRRIIHDIWDALKPGGILVYSTCTYNTEENESNIQHIAEDLGAEVLPLSYPDEWNITGALEGNSPVHRFFPHQTKGEGFFLAVLRKEEGDCNTVKIKKAKDRKKESIPAEFLRWLKQPENFFLNNHNGTIEAFPIIYKEDYTLLTEKLKIISAGLRLGESKGKDLIPHPALALSSVLDKNRFNQTEISWEDAIRYLRKEAISLDPNSEKGYHLITYQKLPIGFVKQLGHRSNNLYPSEWRIRSTYTPDNVKTLKNDII